MDVAIEIKVLRKHIPQNNELKSIASDEQDFLEIN